VSAPPVNPSPDVGDTKPASFNISKWALEHSALTRYLLVVLLLLGSAAYFQLGQDEDPPFTFRAMAMRVFWPGATAQQVAEQVTDKLEKTLQEVPHADKIRSYSKPGEALIIFQVTDSSPPKEVQQIWYTVRKKIGDMRGTLGRFSTTSSAMCTARCTHSRQTVSATTN
jgi:multidrug efflux pump